jgi:hypothetical protein
MGDPTLRMHVVAPPTHLAGSRRGPNFDLEWRASDDSSWVYHVYRSNTPKGRLPV